MIGMKSNKNKTISQLKRTALLVWLCLLGINSIKAVETEYRSVLNGSWIGAANVNLPLEDGMWADMQSNSNWDNEYKHGTVSNIVRLEYTGQEQVEYTGDWQVKVSFYIDAFDEDGNALSGYPGGPYDLTVGFEPDHSINAYQNEEVYTFEGAHKVVVRNISTTFTGTQTLTVVPNDVFLTNEMIVERYFDFDPTDVPTIAHSYLGGSSSITGYGEVQLEWDYIHGAEAYDVEWYFHSDEADPITSFSDIRDLDFTRVRVSGNKYNINMVYDEGDVYYRVRAVGRYFDKTDQIYNGNWSNDFTNDKFGVADHVLKKNWSYQASYAEEGKKREMVTYADGSSRTRQSVTKSNTEDQSLVGESFYDYEGRGVIQTLPTPTANRSNQLKYFSTFSLNGSNTRIEKEDFDVDNTNCAPVDLTMGTNEGASNYYSSSNTEKEGFNAFIPDAELYPYTRATFGRDGRVILQSGPGSEHKIGSGKETKTLFASAFQEKLDRMHGNEVGKANHYSTTMVRDANGQWSKSYMDLSGKTIATSLIGDGPSSLDDLASNTGQATIDVTLDAFNNYNEIEEAYIIQSNLSIEASGNHTFTYKVTPEVYDGLCNSGTYNCKYDLIITLYDECNEEMYENGASSSNPDILHVEKQVVSSTSTEQTFSFVVNFPAVGTYRLEKRLQLNETTFNEAVEDFEAYLHTDGHPCFDDLQDWLDAYTNNIDWSSCLDCDDFCTAYPSLCATGECDVTLEGGICDAYLEGLKDDLSPGGQYFDNLPDEDLVGYDIDEWLDNTNNITTTQKNGLWTLWSADLTGVTLNSWDSVRYYWLEDWADDIVIYHPEHCHYTWCTYTETSNLYDIDLYSTTTMAAAITKGYMTSSTVAGTGILTSDDLVNFDNATTFSFSMYTAMANYVNCYVQHPAPCSGTNTLWLQAQADAITIYGTPTNDQNWQVYRNKYIGEKHRVFEIIKTSANEFNCAYLCDNENVANDIMIDGVADATGPTGCNGTQAGYTINFQNHHGLLAPYQTTTPANTFITDITNYNTAGVHGICFDADLELQTFNNNNDVRIEINGVNISGTVYMPSSGTTNALATQLISDAINNTTSSPDYISTYSGTDIHIEASTPAPSALGKNVDIYIVGIKTKLGEADYCDDPDVNPVCFCVELDLMYDYYDAEGSTDIYTDIATEWTAAYGITVVKADVANWHANCDSDNHYTGNYSLIPEEVLSNCEPQSTDCDTDPDVIAQALFYAEQEYNKLLQAKVEEFKAGYRAHCLNTNNDVGNVFKETFDLEMPDYEYHFTLFYYDQAGNLTRTVPPKGVSLLSSTQVDDVQNHRDDPTTYLTPTYPSHSMETEYKYNTLNQLFWQNTPDGGQSNFWYDAVGRIILSQDAQQVADGLASYMYYDGQGRVEEAGVFTVTTPWPNLTDEVAFRNWVETGSTQKEITKTFYDETPLGSPLTTNEDDYLRSRVSAVQYWENVNDDDYLFASHYSYDPHGNVEKLYQENTLLENISHHLKTIEYDYDLISGNVNEVVYQKDATDMYVHQYSYDADNRLVSARSSHDGYIWDEDAKYFYYQHGPLARKELGEQKVQGLDYAYNIQGWLKGVNGNVLDDQVDMGNDGSLIDEYDANNPDVHRSIARDAFGFTLGYFEDDYTAISTGGNDFFDQIETPSGGLYNNLGNELYNGNIRHMATALMKTDETLETLNASLYRYDQLNRIKNVDVYLGTTYTAATNNGDYHADYIYDANGNLRFLDRNAYGTQQSMDRFEYLYFSGTNRLISVDDSESGTGSSNYGDIQNGQSPANYEYNSRGDLTGDIQEDIDDISWYQNGKVKKIERLTDNSQEMRFYYDAMGQRVVKVARPIKNTVTTNEEAWTYTFYVRDASGNVMATYNRTWEKIDGGQSGDYTDQFNIAEYSVYGSSREGLKLENKELYHHDIRITGHTNKHISSYTSLATPVSATDEEAGQKRRFVSEKAFELSNHLGNVLSVVSDGKLSVDDGVYNGSGTQTSSTPDGRVDYYLADVQSYSDYYPFGMEMPNRHGSSENYRYGFQGQERDDEVKGAGNSINYKFRMHDPRLGRFFAVDPLAPEYPELTPYQFAANQVIHAKELEGLENSMYLSPGGAMNLELEYWKKANKPIVEEVLEPYDKASKAAYKKASNYAFRQAFSDPMPRKLIYHYSYGNGTTYKLSEKEMESIHSSKIGLRKSFVEKFETGSHWIEKGFAAFAMTNGTLGAFTINVKGTLTIMEDGTWEFSGKMQYFDIYDFDPKDLFSDESRRSIAGEIQTRIANWFLPGEGFKVESEWIDVKQDNFSTIFDWFKGKSSELVPNRLFDEVGGDGGEGSEESTEVVEDEAGDG